MDNTVIPSNFTQTSIQLEFQVRSGSLKGNENIIKIGHYNSTMEWNAAFKVMYNSPELQYIFGYCTYGPTAFPVQPTLLEENVWEFFVTPQEIIISCNGDVILNFTLKNDIYGSCTRR